MGILGRISDWRKQSYLIKRIGPAWATFYAEHGRWPGDGIQLQADGALAIPEFNLRIQEGSKAGKALLLNEYLWGTLRDNFGTRLAIEEDGVIAEVDGLRLRLELHGDFDTLREVFVESSYRYEIPGEHLMLDIGANIGLASLYLARYHSGPVHAFELVPSTAKRAQANFDLNPTYASRITLHEYGLGESDQSLEIGIDPSHTAGNTLFKTKGSQVEKVQVRDAATVLSELLPQKEGRSLVIKLDAEGAEYGIVRRWGQADLLRHIDLLMIEWHHVKGESVDEMRSVLRESGFKWIESRKWDTLHGFIHAFR